MPLVKAGEGVARGWFEPGRDLLLACYILFVYLRARPLIEPDSAMQNPKVEYTTSRNIGIRFLRF